MARPGAEGAARRCPKAQWHASLRLALLPLPPGSGTRHGAVGPSRGGCSCRPTCRPASMSRKWKPVPGRSKAWARPSPRSSAWPAPGRSTRRRSSPTGASSPAIFGDFVEGSYLHHAVYGYFQNGGGACYIVRIGGNGAASPAARAELTATTGDAGRGGCQRGRLPGAGPGRGGRGQRHLRGDRRHRRRGRRRGRLQAGRQEGQQGRGDLRQRDDQERPAERRHRRQRPVEADPPRGARRRRRAGVPRHGRPRRAAGRRRPSTWPPTTTSATPPTAPASAAWRRSTR